LFLEEWWARGDSNPKLQVFDTAFQVSQVICCRMLRWLIRTPLGSPVAPKVKRISAISLGWSDTGPLATPVLTQYRRRESDATSHKLGWADKRFALREASVTV
jgi:hypothetical protein